MSSLPDTVRPIQLRDNTLVLIDQRHLPLTEKEYICHHVNDVISAISDMVVRGAPAIGVTAAFGVVLAARYHFANNPLNWTKSIQNDLDRLAKSRPTAINLRWAIDKMTKVFSALDGKDPLPHLLQAAQSMLEEDIVANHRMGELGAELIAKNSHAVLTHCNTGSLATAGFGTALGVIRTAYYQQRITEVYANETRPWLQGARLTAWELQHDNIPVKIITDSAAAHLMKNRQVEWLIVGADRIAANGDTANKIGTYNTAISAKFHHVKVMVVAPTSTIDMNVASGDEIPIELRDNNEMFSLGECHFADPHTQSWNPVFDITPNTLIDALVTEKGVIENPDAEKISRLFDNKSQY